MITAGLGLCLRVSQSYGPRPGPVRYTRVFRYETQKTSLNNVFEPIFFSYPFSSPGHRLDDVIHQLLSVFHNGRVLGVRHEGLH